MSDEAGFEVARAYAVVVPDADDFAAQLDEQIGSLQVSVVVAPDASDFASAVDSQLGDMSVAVSVTPDLSDFEDAIREQASGLTASVMVSAKAGETDFSDAVNEMAGGLQIPVAVVPDLSGFQAALSDELTDLSENIMEGFSGAIPVSVLPDTADFADALDEKLAGLTVSVRVVPDMGDFGQEVQDEASAQPVTVPVTPDASDFGAQVDDQVSDQTGGDGIVIPVTADTSPAVDGLENLEGAEQGAASGASSLGGEFSDLQAQISAVSGDLDALEARFGALTGGMASASEESSAAADALDSADRAVGSVSADIDELGSRITAAGGSISGFEGEISALSGEVGELQGVLASAGDAVDDVGARAFASVQGVQASSDALAGAAGAAGDLSDAAPAASDASSGLSKVLGELSGRMEYMAVDPFMWMYGAPMVIDGVSSAITGLTNTSNGLEHALAQQNNAAGYNVTGLQDYSAALGQAAQSAEAQDKAVVSLADSNARFTGGITGTTGEVGALTAAQQQAATQATDLSGHLSVLEQMYGLSQQQAIALAQAAGVSAGQLEGSGNAADDAMGKVIAYGDANLTAGGSVSQLDSDMMTFANDTLTASSRITALDNAYSSLAGNFAAVQQAQLGVTNDFLGISTAASQAGASMNGTNAASIALQQAFYSTVGAIEQTANAMSTQGDSTAQVTAYIQEQTDKLSLLTGGSQQAQQAVSGLQELEDRLRGSLDSADQAVLTAAGHLQDDFIKQLEDAGAKSGATKTDVDELTDSILATGDKSAETEADRAQLIKDLENAGLTAQAATKLVDQFITSIKNIPSSKTVSIVETATGTITINEAQGTATTQGSGGNSRIVGGATGGLITGGSGHPRADDIHAMLSHGEYVVQASAVGKYGTSLLDSINAMHFADGGYTGGLAGLSAFTGMQYAGFSATVTAQLAALLQAAVAAGKSGGTSGSAPIILNFNGTSWPTPEQQHAMMTQLSAAVGVS